jgi:hypothetical protein
MPELTPKTTDQLRAIFGLGKERDMVKEDLEALAADVSNGQVERLSLLSFDDANLMIVRLGGDAFPAGGGTVPTRTQNYHKQKAGIPTIETAKQVKLIADLARKRNMTAEGLASLCQLVIKRPAPTTTAEGNKIVEALKSMIAREKRRAA